jgi:hypothetical protein
MEWLASNQGLLGETELNIHRMNAVFSYAHTVIIWTDHVTSRDSHISLWLDEKLTDVGLLHETESLRSR